MGGTYAIINSDMRAIMAFIGNARNARDFIYIISNGNKKHIIENFARGSGEGEITRETEKIAQMGEIRGGLAEF